MSFTPSFSMCFTHVSYFVGSQVQIFQTTPSGVQSTSYRTSHGDKESLQSVYVTSLLKNVNIFSNTFFFFKQRFPIYRL